MNETRCDTTELLVDQCACPTHRGGQTPAEDIPTIGQLFTAAHSGVCAAGCELGIEPGDGIVRCWDAAHGYLHAGGCP